MDEIVHNPSLSKHFNRPNVGSLQVLYSFTGVECTSFQSLHQYPSPPRWGHSHQTLESRRSVRHHTVVDHCCLAQRSCSTVANPGLTKTSVAPSGAVSIQLEEVVELEELEFSSASRSTFRHTCPRSTHGFQLHAVPSSFRSHRRPDGVASLHKCAPQPI